MLLSTARSYAMHYLATVKKAHLAVTGTHTLCTHLLFVTSVVAHTAHITAHTAHVCAAVWPL